MIPDGFNLGDKCPTCGHTFYREEGSGYVIEGCSSFCDEVLGEDLETFRNAKPGEYCLFPCAYCGCVVEGEYDPGAVCSDCYRKERESERIRLLRGALEYLPENLAKEVQSELEK